MSSVNTTTSNNKYTPFVMSTIWFMYNDIMYVANRNYYDITKQVRQFIDTQSTKQNSIRHKQNYLRSRNYNYLRPRH